MDHQQGSQPSSSTKVERRIIEKNRRAHMKNLFFKLNSLLPNYNPKESLPLPDQIDRVIKHIESLETRVKAAQEKKASLLTERKRPRSVFETKGSLKSPKIEIHEIGSSVEVVLTCGFDNQFIVFSEIIRIIHEENIEVISASCSRIGDYVLHVVHAEIRPSFYQSGATEVSERLKMFVNGSVTQ
ncbi:hypothetical protein RIF29_05656 [Crotalaria pallida]|uniref:BHLH domain-containing protein n=1 Tax=Crotalaria pallida TaxID=3830 RepID=A0AAN9J298_CROPI